MGGWANRRHNSGMHQPALAYHPPNAVFVVGYPIEQTPITRNEYGRERDSVRAWLDAIWKEKDDLLTSQLREPALS